MLLLLIVFVQFVGCSGVLAISLFVSRCPAGACRQRAAAGLQHLLLRVGPDGGSDHRTVWARRSVPVNGRSRAGGLVAAEGGHVPVQGCSDLENCLGWLGLCPCWY